LFENALIRRFTITQIHADERHLRAISDEHAKDVTNEPGNMMKRMGALNLVPGRAAAPTRFRITGAKEKRKQQDL
jgi:hypothetical protein